ncbi:hypothetical protein RJ640_026592, partial [Escallonia rubra]
GSTDAYDNKEKAAVQMYDRLLNLASSALAEREFKKATSKLWEEPYPQASLWRPCADREAPKSADRELPRVLETEYPGLDIVTLQLGEAQAAKSTERERQNYLSRSLSYHRAHSAEEGRMIVCNAVAVASLLNVTLVIPKFLYSNVWKDPSQFGDIYQEEYFTNTLKNEVDVVKELPPHLRSLDLVAIGSQPASPSSEMEKPTSNTKEKRCAVVTGANKGIGLEICHLLASKGILVILTARDEKKGLKLLKI